MFSRHYRLLSLDKHGLKGPLAIAMGDKAAHPDAKTKVLQVVSRLSPQGLNVLGLETGVDDQGGFSAKPTGMLSRKLGVKIADGVTEAVRKKGKPLLVRDDQFIYTLYQPPIPSAPAMKVLASRMYMDRTGRPLPATATLQVTTACQADCYHCSAARHRRLGQPELTTDQMKSLIRQTEALGVANIVFTGGEPLLRKDLYDLISWVDKDEAIAMMFTNGLLLTEQNCQRLKEAGLFSLNVSIDSPDPKTHNTLRRVERCWERAVEGMERTMAAGLLCGISTYATPERLRNGQVMEMIELARRVGVHEITIFDVVPTGKLLREEEQALLSQEDKDELCRLEKEINEREGYPHVITQAHVNGPTGAGCYAGWFQFYSTAYGEIMPCDFTPLSFGNVLDNSLSDIWETMISHSAYGGHCNHCRMQDAAFRQRWIDPIPAAGPFPFPITNLTESVDGDPESLQPSTAA